MEGAEQRIHLHRLWEGSKQTPRAARSSLLLSAPCVWPVECLDPLLQPEFLPSLQHPAWVWTPEGTLSVTFRTAESLCCHQSLLAWLWGCCSVQLPRVQRDRQVSVLFFWKHLRQVLTGTCSEKCTLEVFKARLEKAQVRPGLEKGMR